jgi:hypothetical protein
MSLWYQVGSGQPWPVNKPPRITLADGLLYHPDELTTQQLNDAGWYEAPARPNINDETHKLSWNNVTNEYVVTALSEEELQAREDAKWADIRHERDEMLKESDLWALLEVERNGSVSTALKTFRTTLRDIPATYTNADDVVFPDWPTHPLD